MGRGETNTHVNQGRECPQRPRKRVERIGGGKAGESKESKGKRARVKVVPSVTELIVRYNLGTAGEGGKGNRAG